MVTSTCFSIAVLPSDGIGPEVIDPCLELLTQVCARVTERARQSGGGEGGLELNLGNWPAEAGHHVEAGEVMPASTLEGTKKADAILLAAMGLLGIRYADGTEISPQLDLRFALGLYAGLRPIRAKIGGCWTSSTPLGTKRTERAWSRCACDPSQCGPTMRIVPWSRRSRVAMPMRPVAFTASTGNKVVTSSSNSLTAQDCRNCKRHQALISTG